MKALTSKYLTPNSENASLAELQALRKTGNRETDRRCLVIIMLLLGSNREQVMKALELSESAIKKIIRAFNAYGADGLVAKKRTG
jgi:transposase